MGRGGLCQVVDGLDSEGQALRLQEQVAVAARDGQQLDRRADAQLPALAFGAQAQAHALPVHLHQQLAVRLRRAEADLVHPLAFAQQQARHGRHRVVAGVHLPAGDVGC